MSFHRAHWSAHLYPTRVTSPTGSDMRWRLIVVVLGTLVLPQGQGEPVFQLKQGGRGRPVATTHRPPVTPLPPSHAAPPPLIPLYPSTPSPAPPLPAPGNRPIHRINHINQMIFIICFAVSSACVALLCFLTKPWKPWQSRRAQTVAAEQRRNANADALRRDMRAIRAHLDSHTVDALSRRERQRHVDEALRKLPVGSWITGSALGDAASTTLDASDSAATSAVATSHTLLVALRPSTAERARGARQSAEADVHTNDAMCAVCLCDFCEGDELRLLPCGHSFHLQCIDKWLHKSKLCEKEPTCPLCNQSALPKPSRSPSPQPKVASSNAAPPLTSEPAEAADTITATTIPEAAHAAGTLARLLGQMEMTSMSLFSRPSARSPARVQPNTPEPANGRLPV